MFYWRQGHRTAVWAGDWKLVRMRGRRREDGWELYNLENDLAETRNVGSQQPGKLDELERIRQRYDDEMIDPVF